MSELASLTWLAPFLSSGGYCSEAISFAQALAKSRVVQFQAVQHGDAVSGAFVAGMSEETRDLLARLFVVRERTTATTTAFNVVVCHSEPGAWSAPRRLYDSGAQCPPDHPSNAYRIGRTMFETDRLPNGWLARLQQLDEIWVPTEFSRRVFLEAGVDDARLQVIGEGVDSAFFDRSRVGVDLPRTSFIDRTRFTTVFCFVGKWEARKNIQTLMRAFTSQFANIPSVALAVVTQKYHSDVDIPLDLNDRILFFNNIDERHLPGFFAEANAFVTATHGEGFGRPIVEAMSMSLPVIAPFWSGMTEYLTPDNSFPIAVSSLEPVGSGPFAEHMWATVDEALLADAMRQVYEQPELARLKGLRARADVLQTMSLESIATKVEQRINQIKQNMLLQTKDEL